jgi:cephalosporin hydroxylase
MGLQFGGLREKVLADPLCQEALSLAKGGTNLAEANPMNLFLLIRFYLSNLLFGHIVEFGSYLGGNAIFMAYVVNVLYLYPGMKVVGLDTFRGTLPTDKSVDAHSAGDFAGVDYDGVCEYIEKIAIKVLELHKRLSEDTAIDSLKEARQMRLAHMDCDIYPSVDYSYEVVKPYMVDGGYMVVDDAIVSSFLGATQVVEDKVIRADGLSSGQIYPHFVFRISLVQLTA